LQAILKGGHSYGAMLPLGETKERHRESRKQKKKREMQGKILRRAPGRNCREGLPEGPT